MVEKYLAILKNSSNTSSLYPSFIGRNASKSVDLQFLLEYDNARREELVKMIEYYVNGFLIPLIGVFGVLGNLLNLTILR